MSCALWLSSHRRSSLSSHASRPCRWKHGAGTALSSSTLCGGQNWNPFSVSMVASLNRSFASSKKLARPATGVSDPTDHKSATVIPSAGEHPPEASPQAALQQNSTDEFTRIKSIVDKLRPDWQQVVQLLYGSELRDILAQRLQHPDEALTSVFSSSSFSEHWPSWQQVKQTLFTDTLSMSKVCASPPQLSKDADVDGHHPKTQQKVPLQGVLEAEEA